MYRPTLFSSQKVKCRLRTEKASRRVCFRRRMSISSASITRQYFDSSCRTRAPSDESLWTFFASQTCWRHNLTSSIPGVEGGLNTEGYKLVTWCRMCYNFEAWLELIVNFANKVMKLSPFTVDHFTVPGRDVGVGPMCVAVCVSQNDF